MNIALIGYGKMGKAIEKIATQSGHHIVAFISTKNKDEIHRLSELNTKVAIEFTNPKSAVDNIKACLVQNIPVVTGTTGWDEDFNKVKKYCIAQNGTMLYASNFSIGVNIFFKVNQYLASIMDRYTEYRVGIEEVHHIHKKDKPSGTAITLANDTLQRIARLNRWELDSRSPEDISVTSIRENEVPGTHSIRYENDIDFVELKHEAKSREGFAIGAVMVSEWIIYKTGFLTMNDFLDL